MFLLWLRLLLAGRGHRALGLAEAIKCAYTYELVSHFCVFLKETRKETLILVQGLRVEGRGSSQMLLVEEVCVWQLLTSWRIGKQTIQVMVGPGY